ncbi:MAG: hypothetical protein OXC68_02805 [Aestuariivita sp.]|nr:hypothetical protein [Aestuariivita sp.]
MNIVSVPKVSIVRDVLDNPELYYPKFEYSLRYRAKKHSELPHIVKFSGGRSSGMLLFILLKNRLLKRERGDVILFNNTSAEHPNTYRCSGLH